jgi:hypothetical protein
MCKGIPAADAAHAFLAAMPPEALIVSDAPEWDSAWLQVLLAVVGAPFPRVRDVTEAYGAACRPLVGRGPHALETVPRLVAEATLTEDMRPGERHRARQDAERLWRIWTGVRRRVRESA